MKIRSRLVVAALALCPAQAFALAPTARAAIGRLASFAAGAGSKVLSGHAVFFGHSIDMKHQ